MPRFKVFHYHVTPETSAEHRFSEAAYREHFPLHYVEVADVEAEALGQVFELTNHLDAPWTDNPQVTLPRADALKLEAARAAFAGRRRELNSSIVLERRSTSVGDVIIDEHGEVFGVAGMGHDALGHYRDIIRHRLLANRESVAELGGRVAYMRAAYLQDLCNTLDLTIPKLKAVTK